jgi:hypothetical protein
MLRCAPILPHGYQDELAVRHAHCHAILQCVYGMPHGLRDKHAVRLELRRGTMQHVSRLPHGFPGDPAVRSVLGSGIMQCRTWRSKASRASFSEALIGMPSMAFTSIAMLECTTARSASTAQMPLRTLN